MRKSYIYAMLLTMPLIALMTSCEPRAYTMEDVIITENTRLEEMLNSENPQGYKIYNFNDLIEEFCKLEQGNFESDSSLYRTRTHYKNLYLFSIDTLPKEGQGIYIRGRIATDDYGGNFYKSLVLQQVNDWSKEGHPAIDQQCLRVSVDLGSVNGQFPQGAEVLIRCNGMAIGRYANEPQLCVPSYNNNIYASSATEKTGWAPGRIPSDQFRKAVSMIGSPDKSKLVYDQMTLAELNTKFLGQYKDVVGVRKIDARLVKITGVHFSGEYETQNDGAAKCTRYLADSTDVGNPELDGNACTFGPTTGNVGYPQSRYVKDDAKNKVLIGTSEYARYAYYYLPSAKYVGTITGVLGYYMDNGKYDPKKSNWSITPCNIGDILPEAQAENANPRWIPTEWRLGTPQPED